MFVYCPPNVEFDTPAVAPLTAAFGDCGWRPQSAYRHYEFEVGAGVGDGIAVELRLERLVRADDERLLSVFPRVFSGSLDQDHIDAVNRLGFDAAWCRVLDDLLTADPVEWIRLAFDPARDCVGVVAGDVVGGRAGFVTFVGVAEAFRGRGYGRQLLAAMTREHVSKGATTLIADTDNQNWPMGKAFADVGWLQTESRLDFARV